MHTLTARSSHETNTFSPVPTPLASFHPHYGTDAYHATKGTRTAADASIDLAEATGAEIVVPVVARASPNRRVAAEACTTLCDAIVTVAPRCDTLLPNLHGVMVAENSDDDEGDLSKRLHAVVPDVPITVALDLRGNLTQRFIDLADIAVGFKAYPHVDMCETGEHTSRLLFDKLAGRANPMLTQRRLLMVTHTLRNRTDEGATHHTVALAEQAETDGILAVSILAGFGLMDIAAPCLPVVMVGDGDKHTADAAAQHIADTIWGDREGFVYRSEPLTESTARTAKLVDAPGSNPALLLDHGDNCTSDDTCDDMRVLHKALRRGLSDITIELMCDPETVAAMIKAGEGATVTLPIGDEVPLMQFDIYPVPRALMDKAVTINDGEYTITGPTYMSRRIRMGRTALLGIGAAQIVVTETSQEHWDLGTFTYIGVDPHAACSVLLKSHMYCRPVFMSIARTVVEYGGGGATSSGCTRLPFMKVQRPVFPLDADAIPA